MRKRRGRSDVCLRRISKGALTTGGLGVAAESLDGEEKKRISADHQN